MYFAGLPRRVRQKGVVGAMVRPQEMQIKPRIGKLPITGRDGWMIVVFAITSVSCLDLELVSLTSGRRSCLNRRETTFKMTVLRVIHVPVLVVILVAGGLAQSAEVTRVSTSGEDL